jgi:hypothetical protein
VRVDPAHHSVLISDSYVDNMMTLYCLRRQNGRPPNYIWYMYYTGRQKGIQYMYIMCPMGRESLYAFLMLDIGYSIESNRRTAWLKLHTAQLLPTGCMQGLGRY